MSNINYTKSYDFEFFISLARLCDPDEFGAHNSYMHNLMNKEEGEGQVSHLKHQKLLADVKRYMISATKFAIKRKISKPDKEIFIRYLEEIETSSTSKELLKICDEGTEILLKYKPQFEI